MVFLLYLLMQHPTVAHFSSSIFNFFLVLLSNTLAIAFSVCQSPDNTAFEQSIKFWKSMKTLLVFTSSNSNSKRSALFLPHFYSCSIMAVFVPGLSFSFVLANKIWQTFKTVPNLMCRRAVTTLDCIYWEYCCMNNWFMKLPWFMTMMTCYMIFNISL